MPSVLEALKHHLSNIESGELMEPYLCVSILTELLDIVQHEEDPEVIWDFTQILPEVALVSLRVQQHVSVLLVYFCWGVLLAAVLR